MPRYLVLALRTPQFQPAVIEPHLAFLDGLRAQGRLELSGPFTDGSGGAYLIAADDLQHANALAFGDPLHTTGSSLISLYEWNAT